MTIDKKEAINQIKGWLVKIPQGSITLRDDRIKKQWVEEIQSFYISKYVITQEVFSAIVDYNPSTFTGNRRPVETVTWLDCVNFCNALSHLFDLMPFYEIDSLNSLVIKQENSDGFRLPTDAEWEYACKAGSSSPQYDDINKIAWYKNNSNGTTQNIGLKKPNHWGLYDMLGNIWEWCSDIYNEDTYGSYRIIRGGGWNDDERGCLATNRRRSHPTAYKIDDLGFRIARNVE